MNSHNWEQKNEIFWTRINVGGGGGAGNRGWLYPEITHEIWSQLLARINE